VHDLSWPGKLRKRKVGDSHFRNMHSRYHEADVERTPQLRAMPCAEVMQHHWWKTPSRPCLKAAKQYGEARDHGGASCFSPSHGNGSVSSSSSAKNPFPPSMTSFTWSEFA
jgi:hypothetical protein